MARYYYKHGSVLDHYDNNKVLHREDGPAIEWDNGDKQWWVNNTIHRVDGPAVETSLRKEWWVNGKQHRVEGPAVEYSNGEREYWINGKLLFQEVFEAHLLRQKYLFEQELERVLA